MAHKKIVCLGGSGYFRLVLQDLAVAFYHEWDSLPRLRDLFCP